MRYSLTHSTTYTYGQAVVLSPHTFRLKPRTDPFQVLESYQLQILPTPTGISEVVDAVGNPMTCTWWSEQTTPELTVTAQSTVLTPCENPFLYILEPWAVQFPLDYPRSLFNSLFHYLDESAQPFGNSGTVTELAQELAAKANYNTTAFLALLNQTIYQHCQYQLRLTGTANPPHQTWQLKLGSCRDFVVLFMAACRAVGLAARFVSGYEQGDPEHEKHLHAWVEVYLPGAGWRGYDPTLGLVVCDRHIALCAHVLPEYTAPVAGAHRPVTTTSMTTHVEIIVED